MPVTCPCRLRPPRFRADSFQLRDQRPEKLPRVVRGVHFLRHGKHGAIAIQQLRCPRRPEEFPPIHFHLLDDGIRRPRELIVRIARERVGDGFFRGVFQM